MASGRKLRLLLAAAVWLAGCNVFDDDLEKRLDEANEEEPDAGDGDGDVDAGGPVLQLANACSSSLPSIDGVLTTYAVPIVGLTSNVKEAGCGVDKKRLEGAEGFFQIDAKAGDRWHFHLQPAMGQNLAVLASRGCDLRECVAAADVCGANESEHFTFIPTQAGKYTVVVEGIDPKVAGDLTLLAVNAKCGDGMKEHSEVCEDGNLTTGDGCDQICRVEKLTQSSMETEPNDDSFGANVLIPPNLAQAITVTGSIADLCQPDYFMFRVETEQHLVATLLQANGQPCTMAPAIDMQLLPSADDLREGDEIASGSGTDGMCPAIDTTLEPGTYFVRLHHTKVDAPDFKYKLSLTLSDPPAPPEGM